MVKPRQYQQLAVRNARKALKASGRALIVLATGLGKTITSALVWKQFVRGKGLFLVHNNGILDVAVTEYRKVFGESAKFALFNGYSKDIEGADVVFATFQSMRGNLKQFSQNYFSWMTVDETHHAHAASYRTVIEHFTCSRLGITATPDRADLQDIRELFGNEVVDVQLEEAIARGWLPKVEYHLVTDQGFDEAALEQLIDEVVSEGRRMPLSEINRRVFIRARDAKVASIISEYGESTVIFCRSIAHAEHFNSFLERSEVYHSNNSQRRNRQILENLRTGITQRVLAVNAFNEGIDVPDVGLVVFYRTTDSETVFRQQLGRGLRPGKKKLTVLDFVGNVERMQLLREITGTIAKIHEGAVSGQERLRGGYEYNELHLTGIGFEFTFTNKLVDLMKVVDRVNVDFYPTWQEASAAAQKIGINSYGRYQKRYCEDTKLPSHPHGTYKATWPGWPAFFGRAKVDPYSTWQEASAAARRLGIKNQPMYRKGYKQDPKLPAVPEVLYKNFPGYRTFFGRNREALYYGTWQEAGKAAQQLGITNWSEYCQLHKKDPKLPRALHVIYKDYPGWLAFLKNQTKS